MVEPQASMFWQSALKSGLLDAAKLERCWEAVPPEKRGEPDAVDRRLARQAVAAGLLTVWQAQQLLAGRYYGLRIDRYEIRDLLGQGGMGRVYLARDTKLRRPVALKILSRERMNNPRALARFRREARVGAQLQHENLIRVYDEGEAHGIRFLVMEYIPGQTVGHMIHEQGRLPWSLASALARQVALGLEHLAQKGLLHRDVNPMNILVDRDGTAKLTDLGLAIDPDAEDEEVVTRDGATVGTFDYISPEQARHSRQIDSRSDIYSLGCTLYHMIAGRVPFPAPSLPEKLLAHQSSAAEPLTKLVPGVPEGLDAVVRRMMGKRAEDRFARPREAARALEPYALAEVPDAVGDPHTPPLPLAVRKENATVVENGTPAGQAPPVSVLSRSASDSMLAPTSGVGAASAPSWPPPPTSGSRPSDPFGIDFGPPEPLAEVRSGTRSSTRSGTGDGDRARPNLWVALGALSAVLLVLGALAAYRAGWFSRAAPGPAGQGREDVAGPAAPAKGPEPPPAPLRVVYKDGDTWTPPNLLDAIERAAGNDAEVILANAEPISIRVDRPIRLSDGRLTLRAADGTAPVVAVTFGAATTLFETLPRSQIRLVGLTLRVESAPAGGAPATLLGSHGEVSLERCAIVAAPGGRAVRVLAAEGRRTRLAGCWIEGFDAPLYLRMLPGAEAELSQTMIVRTGEADPASGWAVTAVASPLPLVAPRRLVLDRCTVAGTGLIRAEGFGAGAPPLRVEVRDCAIRVRSLSMWAGPFPGGLDYQGRGNLYRVASPAWVVQAPGGVEPIPDGPANFEAWAAGPGREEGSRALDFRFRDDAPSDGHVPSDFALRDVDPPRPGADPARVGPEASAASGDPR